MTTQTLTAEEKQELVSVLAKLTLMELLIDMIGTEMAEEEKTCEERVYSEYCYTTKNPELFRTLSYLGGMRDALGGDNPLYKKLLKQTSNIVRKQIGIDCMVGFAQDFSTGEVVVFAFEGVKATEENFYDSGYDEELKQPYLILN
ncbi:hypothetical protein [Peribacillus asahii]|uniref:hypothetical protein n=1 Tax=Peribacillus asahii TaxID=228899 RepID=UPI00380E2512